MPSNTLERTYCHASLFVGQLCQQFTTACFILVLFLQDGDIPCFIISCVAPAVIISQSKMHETISIDSSLFSCSFNTAQTRVALYMTAIASVSGSVQKPLVKVLKFFIMHLHFCAWLLFTWKSLILSFMPLSIYMLGFSGARIKGHIIWFSSNWGITNNFVTNIITDWLEMYNDLTILLMRLFWEIFLVSLLYYLLAQLCSSIADCIFRWCCSW